MPPISIVSRANPSADAMKPNQFVWYTEILRCEDSTELYVLVAYQSIGKFVAPTSEV